MGEIKIKAYRSHRRPRTLQPPPTLTASPDNGFKFEPGGALCVLERNCCNCLQAQRAIFSRFTLFLEKIPYALPKELHTDCENAGGRTKFSEDHAHGSGSSPEYLLAEYGDPKVGGVNGMGDGHGSHLSTGGVGGKGRHDLDCGIGCDGIGGCSISQGGHLGNAGGGGSGSHGSVATGVSFVKSKMKLADKCAEQPRSILMLAAVYFGVVGFSNTIIARGLQGEGNETLSFLRDLSKANHMFFQVFVLVNIFGFATSSGSLLIRGRGKLKSEVMFLTCSIISILCMAFSFGVLLVCAFCSLSVLAVNGSND